MTVTGTTLSSSSQTWVMPILRPRIMLIKISISNSRVVLGQCVRHRAYAPRGPLLTTTCSPALYFARTT